jgi:2-dehydropantoate 2-reductase
MRIAIVGAGAMGLLFTHLLSRDTQSEIWLLDIHPARERKIREEGLWVEGVSGEHHLLPRITSRPEEIGPADLLILCVKSPDTFEAAQNARPAVGPDTGALTLQNGLGNIESIERALGTGRALGGTTSMGATALGPNRVRHAGWGETIIGETTGRKTRRAAEVLEVFRRAGLDASYTDNLTGLLWSKLIINVGINALTALTGIHNGRLLHHEGTRRVMKAAVEEAAQVAHAQGIRLLYEDPVGKVAAVCEATAGNIASMLQDVLRQRRTEIEQINGAVVRHAAGLGLRAPVNETLLGLVKTLEETYAVRIQKG